VDAGDADQKVALNLKRRLRPAPSCPTTRTSGSTEGAGRSRQPATAKRRRTASVNAQKTKALSAKHQAQEEVAALQGVTITSARDEFDFPDVGGVVSLGSDCSGLGTDKVALELADLSVRAVFACELDSDVRKLFQSIHGKSVLLQSDIRHDHLRARVDLYVAGPPCQSWSVMGNRAGLDDLAGRGLVFYHCLDYVRARKPRAVVFENVMGLRTQHVEELRDILHILQSLGYAVTWDAIKASECGLPQSRARLYVVGILNTSRKANFTFPAKMRVVPSVDKFLVQRPARAFLAKTLTAKRNLQVGLKKLAGAGVNPQEQTCFIDIYASPSYTQARVGRSPCITATRAAQGGYYITNQRRMTETEELGRLQGWPTSYIHRMVASGVAQKVIRHAIGNGMSMNVVYRLLPRVLLAAGLVNERPQDKWKHLTRKMTEAEGYLPDMLFLPGKP
jgi:DNA-cytosine methyltransferase